MPRWMRPQASLVSRLKKWVPQINRPQWLGGCLSGRFGAALGMLLVAGLAFGMGRWIGLGAAGAQTPTRPAPPGGQPGISNLTGKEHLYPEDYTGRVVAYIYGNVPITRVELAEYLIARFGKERIEFLVNRKIVEKACLAQGINVTDMEVDLQVRKDCAAVGPTVNPELFEKTILKKFGKTLYEWKEDVIRPKLALGKMIERQPVHVDQADVQKAFDIMYGEKRQCRMIVYPDVHKANAAWQKMRSSPDLREAFHAEAINQMIPELRPSAGKVPPIHRHFPSPEIERAAFMLRPGEISAVIGMPDHQAIILLCDAHEPPDSSKSIDRERPTLMKELIEQKKSKMMQELVLKLREEANARFLMGRQHVVREAQEELQAGDLLYKKTDR